MREINCYIPIKVRVVGKLNDSQLTELASVVERLVRERMVFAQRTLAAYSIAPRAGSSNPPVEHFESARWMSETEAYVIPSYKDGGTPVGVKIRSSKQKRSQISLVDEVREEVKKKIQGQPLDLGTIADRAFIANWRKELVLWTYSNFFAGKKPPKEAELRKILTWIEKTIVLPLMNEQFRAFYERVNDPHHFLSLTPEFEYAGLPEKVKSTIEGGLSGWLRIRDEIAAKLVPEMQSNLLRFYDMAPNGKMVEAKLWPGEEGVIVHEDVAAALELAASMLESLVPILKGKYRDFWKHHSALGLQIRHIHGKPKLSPHTVGKAIDIAANWNPHLTDRRILRIISLLGEIESMKNIQAWSKRHALLARQREAVLVGRAMSEEFKRFLLEAEDRYREWIAAQEKFKSNFPEVTREAKRLLVLQEVVQRVKAEHEKVKITLDKVAENLEEVRKAQEQAQHDQKTREDERKHLHESLSKPRKKQQGTRETQAGMTLSEVRARLKELDRLLRDARKAVTKATQEHKKIEEEYKRTKEDYDLLGKLSTDLIGNDDLLFREGTDAAGSGSKNVEDETLLFKEEVTDPGLAVIRNKGYLSIPWEVVQVFLEHGFDWGALWEHPDFMHFEWAGQVSGEAE